MRSPWFMAASVAASGAAWSPGALPLVRARTMSLTARVTFGGSHDDDATIYLYYSPDGENWDTIAYTSFSISYATSTTKQRTAIIDLPEHGFIRVKVNNDSSADVLSNVKVWYSIQSWAGQGAMERGTILKDTGEDVGGA